MLREVWPPFPNTATADKIGLSTLLQPSIGTVRESVGLFDQSSFAKFQFEGRDAQAVLNRICTADVDVPIGKIVYTQWLNEQGRIEADPMP